MMQFASSPLRQDLSVSYIIDLISIAPKNFSQNHWKRIGNILKQKKIKYSTIKYLIFPFVPRDGFKTTKIIKIQTIELYT